MGHLANFFRLVPQHAPNTFISPGGPSLARIRVAVTRRLFEAISETDKRHENDVFFIVA